LKNNAPPTLGRQNADNPQYINCESLSLPKILEKTSEETPSASLAEESVDKPRTEGPEKGRRQPARMRIRAYANRNSETMAPKDHLIGEAIA
jgi:hypothetical protein